MKTFKILPRLIAVFGVLMMLAVAGWGADMCTSNVSKTFTSSAPGNSYVDTVALSNNTDQIYYFQAPAAGTVTFTVTGDASSYSYYYSLATCPATTTTIANNGTITLTNDADFNFKVRANAGNKSVTITLVFTPAVTLPTVSISPTTLSTIEGNTSTTNAIYTVTLSATPTSAVSIPYTVAGSGTYPATSGTDFTATSGTLTFPIGASGSNLSQTITVPIIGDSMTENDETYTVTLSPTNATPTALSATGTITNDDPPPQVGWEQVSYQTSENLSLPYGGPSPVTLKITLDHAVDYDVSVNYATASGTATGGVDFGSSTWHATIPAGATSVFVDLDIYHDEPIELMENFTVALTNPTGSGGAVLKPGYDVTTVSIMAQDTAPLCYSDNFNATSLDGTWRTLLSSGSFTPDIIDNRLRMTPASGNIATAVTKDFQFASSQNLIIVEFTHYAYSGSGADGLAMVLYDSAVGANPAPGAFGGSLGYAQKSNPGSDCTVVGGCPGFQGGWLGLGIDEYGNYQNPTEGRIGGTAFTPNAISIRGDGSGVSGYEYLAGTTSQTPALWDSGIAPLPGDKFRMTVDARDTAHLYIRLERDTSGTGNSYQTIINEFDAKNTTYAQSTTPAFVRLALTASTGGSNAIHEIDDMTVWGICTPYSPLPPAPLIGNMDVIEHAAYIAPNPDGYAAADKNITTKLVNKPFDLEAVYLNPDRTEKVYNGTIGNKTVNMAVMLYTTDTGTCSEERQLIWDGQLMHNTSHIEASVTGIASGMTKSFLLTKAAKDQRIKASFIDYGTLINNATSLNCSASSLDSSLCLVPACMNSDTQILQAFPVATYPYVTTCLYGDGTANTKAPCDSNAYYGSCGGKKATISPSKYNNDIGCAMCLSDALGMNGCSSDNFATRPEKLVINSTHADMPNLLRAGQDYNVSIDAYNYNNTTVNTPDYNVSAANTVFTLATTKYNRNNAVTPSMAGAATFAANDFNMSNGKSVKSGVAGYEVAGLTFSDVGKINLSIQDRAWSAVDNDDTPQDCTINGTYICGDKNVTFIPDSFDFNELNITNNNGSPGTFTYIANEVDQMAGRIHTQIRALNKDGNVTANFATFPLWENNISITPVVTSGLYLYPDANETTITNLALGFTAGTKTIPWNETNTSQYLRFNFQRDFNPATPPSPFDVNGSDLNILAASTYTDPEDADTAFINGSRNGDANGSSKFIYGRIIPRDVRVFGQVPFTANAWYEVFGTTLIGATALPASKNDASWYTNTLHNDISDGDANVTAVVTATSTTLPISSVSNATGIESYLFNEETPPYGAKAHIATNPWLWYGTNASSYANPGTDCLTHPCFNINVVPAVGATGSAKTGAETKKASKKSTSEAGGTGWKSTSDYAPAIR